jgi:cytidyltransferase-like protein
MFLNELAEPQLLVIYPGRFQPFHKGHHAVYEHLATKFGRNNVFIATSNKVEQPKSPFSYSEKKYFMQLTGVPDDRIVQASNPYQIQSISQASNIHIADPSNTVVIFAVSEKDMAEDPRFSFKPKADGSDPYFQPLKNIKDTVSMEQHGYIMTVPTFDFTVLGQPMRSGTELRKMYVDSTELRRQQIIQDLFGRYTREAEKLMNDRLVPAAPVQAPAVGRKTKLQKVAVPKEPVAESVVYEVGRFKDGYWIPLEQHATPTQAEFHAKNIKKKYPSMEVGIKTQDGQVNLVGLKEEAAGVGVIANKKQANDPRYKTSLTKDVRPGQIKKSLKAFSLAEEDLAWVRSRLGESAVNALAARHIEYISQDIAAIKERITTEKLPAEYVDKLKQKIAELEQERAKLAFDPL